MVGTKGWVFHEPLDYERVMDPIAIPASVPRDKTEKDMVEDGKVQNISYFLYIVLFIT